MLEIGLQFGRPSTSGLSAFPKGKVYGLEYNRLKLKQAAGDKTQRRGPLFSEATKRM